jgi:hypothetical protein
MFGQELIRPRIKVNSVLRARKAVALIGVQDIFYWNAFFLHGKSYLVGFGLLYPGIICTMPNEKRCSDLVDVKQRGYFLIKVRIIINISDFEELNKSKNMRKVILESVAVNITNSAHHSISQRGPIGRNTVQ